MSKLLILLLCCAGLISAQTQNCPSGENFECRCPCGLTCGTLNNPCLEVIICSCYCQAGYTRRITNGTCIPISSCPPSNG
ncbi:inducible metalloproteinase inhibitor protein-like [Spodoptera litura]|uniref:Inducible metalloproteinase inhibitor protein-like n=1 Tax=Spodoptera litura TaxID=69820 RepID=A0A9J7DV92_SPOLT|nr:inducible metalloproteinase inhibitor protein-like [Spodoptera litura]